MMKRLISIAGLALAALSPICADPLPPPTEANVHYGPDAAQVLDFWKAPSDKPTPLIFNIHGGGWLAGDKSSLYLGYPIEKFLAAGISVVSINYRLIHQINLEGKTAPPPITPERVAHEEPPVAVPLMDAAHALQFVRSKAAGWNIDKTRIDLSGDSAGACTSLWLAFHQDMADPNSPDPMARESTRPWCAAVLVPQTTLDPKVMREWMPNSVYGGHAFGFPQDPKDPNGPMTQFNQFLAARDIVLPWIERYSPCSVMTADAPPIYLLFGDAPARGKEPKDPTHSANFGAILMEKAKPLGLEVEFNYSGAPDITHKSIGDYLLWKLKAPTQFAAKP